MEAASSPSDLARIVLRVDWSGEEVRAIDLFPRRSSWSNECLPPPDERGDVWLAPARLKVTLRLPVWMKAPIQVREGRVEDRRPAGNPRVEPL